MTDRELALRTYRLVRELMYQRALENAKANPDPAGKKSVWQLAEDAVEYAETTCHYDTDEEDPNP